MNRCYFNGTSNRGNEFWGTRICTFQVEHNLVSFCRAALNNRFTKYWVYPVWFDPTYLPWTDTFYKYVGFELLPKLTKVPAFKKGMDIDVYRHLVWETAHIDYDANIRKGVAPLYYIAAGIASKKYRRVLGIRQVSRAWMYNRSLDTDLEKVKHFSMCEGSPRRKHRCE